MVLYAQTKQVVNTHITFGSGIECEVSTDVCGMTYGEKDRANVVLSYEKKTALLVLIINKGHLEIANQKKLLAVPKKTDKDTYQYTFSYDNPIPSGILNQLGLKGKFYIKKGVYPFQVIGGNLIMKLPLIQK